MPKIRPILLLLAAGTFANTASAEILEDQWSQKLTESRGNNPPAASSTAMRAALFSGQVEDGSGDTFGSTSPVLDILTLSAYFNATHLTVTLSFNMNILPCENYTGVIRENEVSLSGFIDIDSDQNGTTGVESHVYSQTGANLGLGQDYFVDLCTYSSATQTVNVFRGTAPQDVTGQASAAYTASTLTLSIPLSALGNDDGNVNLAALTGTLSEPSDLAPNGGALSSAAATTGATSSQVQSIPVFNTLGLLLLSLLSGVAASRVLKKRG